jgi:hypothetical protein
MELLNILPFAAIIDRYGYLSGGVEMDLGAVAVGDGPFTDTYSVSTSGGGVGISPHTTFNMVVGTEDFASGGSATVRFEIQGSNNLSTWVTLYASEDIAVADLVAGYEIMKGVRIGDAKKYKDIRFNAAVGTANLTAGKVFAWLGTD